MTIAHRFTFPGATAFLDGFTNYEKRGTLTLRRGDLARMARLLDAIGAPQRGIPAVHVTGSKGKGTTCMALEALLSAAGKHTGTYLSPHLECVTERIRIGGAQVSRARFAAALNALKDPIERIAPPPTYFEILTALAWHIFREAGVGIAIVEAGIGGAFDATALCEPVAAVVTGVEREHTEVLGRTEAEILAQKLRIGRAGIPLLVGPLKPALLAQAREYARDTGAQLVAWRDAVALRRRHGIAHAALKPPLPPFACTFQAPDAPFAVNATLALAASTLVLGEPPACAACVLAGVRVEGRKEVYPGKPPIVIDVAHTYRSIQALMHMLAVEFAGRPVTIVFALARDKPRGRLLPLVRKHARTLVLVQADDARGCATEELAACCPAGGGPMIAAAGVDDAMAKAAARTTPAGVVCVCGSFPLAGKARRWVRRRPAAP